MAAALTFAMSPSRARAESAVAQQTLTPAGVVLGALLASELVYLSPLRSDGGFSRCRAEIWFIYVDAALYVVTANDAWRSRAIERGLRRTQVWVGDVGPWGGSEGAYLDLPKLQADGALVSEAAVHNHVLGAMGGKYHAEWSVWGPRFRDGLADGSRVMLRYQPLLG